MFLEDFDAGCVCTDDFRCIESCSDVELAFKCVFYSLFFGCTARSNQQCGCKNKRVSHNLLVFSSFFDFHVDLVDYVVLKFILRDDPHCEDEKDCRYHAYKPEDALLCERSLV